MNFNQFDEQVTARAELYLLLDKQSKEIASLTQYFSIPQRKAKLHDKQRIRLKDAKSWAFRRSGCNNTVEIKKYLKVLGKKLDLRMTSAWIAVNLEFADSIKQLKNAENFKVGTRVEWTGYKPIDAHICAWFPLIITAIIDGKAQLDVWSHLVPLEELIAVA